MSTWSEHHHIDLDEFEIPAEDRFDARREGWAKYTPDEYDFVDDDGYPHE